MNKSELTKKITIKTGMSEKEINAAINALTEAVTDALKDGDKVALTGFGTFEVKERAARTGKNPRTGETVEIAAKRIPAFKPAKALKDAVE